MAYPAEVASRRRFPIKAVVIALSALLLIAVGAAAYLFFGTDGLALRPNVYLAVPGSYDLAEINQPLTVQAVAEYNAGIVRSELYADGALIAVQGSTFPEGSNPLLFLQSWQPLTQGRHLLMVRAYSKSGKRADSNIVDLRVFTVLARGTRFSIDDWPRPAGTPPPSLETIAKQTGVGLEDLLAANPGLEGFDSRAPLPSGTIIELPRPVGTSAPAPLAVAPLPGTPGAPANVQATLDCAQAQVSWQDSADETAYVVYRFGPGDTQLNPIANLPANATSYAAPLGAPGEYHFQVAAQRDELEGLSLMTAGSTPPACAASPPAGASDLALTLASLETDGLYDGIYCYFALDGAPHERFPAADFALFSPVPGEPRRYNLQTQLPAAGQFVLLAHQSGAPVTINGECLGRSGPDTESLGTLAASAGPDQWDNSELEAILPYEPAMIASAAQAPPGTRLRMVAPAAFRLRYRIGPNTPADRIRALDPSLLIDPALISGGGSVTNPADLLPLDVRALDPGLLLPATTEAPAIPAPFSVRLEQRLSDGCATLPADAPATERLLCQTIGIPGLTWDTGASTAFDQNRLTGFHVRAAAIDPTGGGERTLWERDIAAASPRALVLPVEGLPCGTTIAYTVAAVAGDLRSFRSDAATQTTPRCEGLARVSVTLVSMTTSGSVADSRATPAGAAADSELEIGGALFAGRSRADRGPTEAYREWQAFPIASNAALALGGIPMRGAPAAIAGRDNNRLAVVVRDGESLPLGLRLYEEDAFPETAPGLVRRQECPAGAMAELPARSAAEWASLSGETLDLSIDCGQGRIAVTLLIEGEQYR